jgi:hypothetical protein
LAKNSTAPDPTGGDNMREFLKWVTSFKENFTINTTETHFTLEIRES